MKSSNFANISCLEINFFFSSFNIPVFSFLYGGFVTIASKELFSYILSRFIIFSFIISNLSPKLFSLELLFAISATSCCTSTPIILLKFVFPHNNIDIIPVPVPKSSTFESFFMFLAKSDNSTASIPKQNPF